MARTPRPLTPAEAKGSLANRFGRIADRTRQLATKFGIRPNRVFRVLTRYTGEERGEGKEVEVWRKEILPTPKVETFDTIGLNPFSAGVLPVGTIRVTGITITLTEDDLRGHDDKGEPVKDPYDFFYEVVEDGRGDDPAPRTRYRIVSWTRRAGMVDWSITLERVSEDRDRSARSQIGG